MVFSNASYTSQRRSNTLRSHGFVASWRDHIRSAFLWRSHLFKSMFETCESNYHNSYIVKTPSMKSVFHDAFSSWSQRFMNVWIFNWIDCVPNAVNTISICQFIKDAITAKYNEIMRIIKFEGLYVWLSSNNLRWLFCFKVSKSSTNWQSSWKYSDWSNDDLWLGWLSVIIKSLSNCCCLINLSTSWLYSSFFAFLTWLVINW